MRSYRPLFPVSLLLMFLLAACRESTDLIPPPQEKIDETILGALRYLDDMQIRDRAGKNSCLNDTSEGGGCINDTQTLPGVSPLPIPNTPTVQNREGEWASFIYHLPGSVGILGLSRPRTQDSALIVSAFITYPLFLFSKEDEENRDLPIDTMLDLSIRNLKGFRRGKGYNFWPQREDLPIPQIVSPYNIDMPAVDRMLQQYLGNPDDPLYKTLFGEKIIAQLHGWIVRCMQSPRNREGVYALFNIPNDADDLSMATAIFGLYAKRNDLENTFVETDILTNVSLFLDTNRTKEDGRDSFKGKNSGAFLTWQKDENEPIFDHPESGVIPLAVNNVDAVVNANVLFSLALNNLTQTKGFRESVTLLANLIESGAWPKAALYYPQRMMFPYAVTRAWRDGGIHSPGMRIAMRRLMTDLLQEQKLDDPTKPHYGRFDGGIDRSRDLPTALGCIALLNMGEAIASEANLLKRYRQGIDACIASLVRFREPVARHDRQTSDTTDASLPIYRWQEGIFFSPSVSELVQWHSRPLTAAMVVEALAKYRLNYHKNESTILQTQKLSIHMLVKEHKG